MSASPTRICWDEHGGLYLPPEYAYIGVAMDRRDAADEMQRAFDGARRARTTSSASSDYDWPDHAAAALLAGLRALDASDERVAEGELAAFEEAAYITAEWESEGYAEDSEPDSGGGS